MTATEEQHGQLNTGYPHTLRPELHKALEAEGIDYWLADGITFWNRDDGCECLAYGFDADGVPKLAIKVVGFTDPAQAIAATLGRGTCHDISKIVDKYGQARFACSECGAWIDSRMLWNPEYRNGESPWVNDCKLNYCPNCGRRIVDPTTNDVDAEVDDG